MPRLPVPGGDSGSWGTILNDFLLSEHLPNGKLRPDGSMSQAVLKTGGSMTGSLNVPGGNVTPIDWKNVKTYGAKGDGLSDDTAAIQSAINSGGTIYFPTGSYMVTGLILKEKVNLIGDGSGTYSGFEVGDGISEIKLASNANTPVITIPAGAGAGKISDLKIEGNKNNQTTGSPQGILFQAALAPEESQWRIERCFINATRGTAIEIQSNRQANRIRDCSIFAAGFYGIDCSASDQILTGNLIGLCFLDGILANQSVIHIFAGDIFGNRNGINLSSAAKGCMVTNTGIDRNNQAGIYCAGSSISISTCTFHTNSQTSSGGWPDIQITDQYSSGQAILITGCSFWHDSSYINKSDYHIRLDHTALANIVACEQENGSSLNGMINNSARSNPLLVKPDITGSKDGNAALESLINGLTLAGLINDSTD